MNTTYELFLLDLENNKSNNICSFLPCNANLPYQGIQQLLKPFLLQYQEQMKVNDLWLVLGEYQPFQEGYVACYRASYSDNISDKEGTLPFYVDVAEHDERVLFDSIANEGKGIVFSDTLAIKLGVI